MAFQVLHWVPLLTTILQFLQIATGILLILGILIQHRASGLSQTFGGAGATFVQRRGAERAVYIFSVWLSVAFFVLAVLQWYA
ncbi:MAG: preprotein translocase subunit SecG [Patescibacteria group bacterium]